MHTLATRYEKCTMLSGGEYWEDLLRKMNYYFRIGDKIGAIDRKYARMQIADS